MRAHLKNTAHQLGLLIIQRPPFTAILKKRCLYFTIVAIFGQASAVIATPINIWGQCTHTLPRCKATHDQRPDYGSHDTQFSPHFSTSDT
ncbi:hypothetical protein BDZ94DRAFT_1254228 [Collybia nuda]|uniref:Uncharacterized protein n=1 Tax=Collybia nuda TaxID=64659 RepID=A0A9P6CLV8_9AGAR|nr:hypothetical protein BDZ94DRAFT_1254228 [Collybia nuda]